MQSNDDPNGWEPRRSERTYQPIRTTGFIGPLALGFDPQEEDPRGPIEVAGTPAQQAASLERLRAQAAADPLPYDLDPDPF